MRIIKMSSLPQPPSNAIEVSATPAPGYASRKMTAE